MKKFIIFAILSLSLFTNVVFANEWSNDTSIIRASVTYKDVDASFWAYDSIMNSTRYGWFSGYPDGTFQPNNEITRAESSKAVANLLKKKTVKPIMPTYSDIDVDSWYSPYIEVTKDYFYPKYGSEFKPSVGITREDALYMMVKAYGYDTLVGSVSLSVLDCFSDNMHIDENMREFVAVGIHYGLMAGFSDGTLRPKAILTRAQFATILDRLYSVGPNNVPTKAMLERIEINVDDYVNVSLNDKIEVTASAVYADGSRMDYTKNLNPYTDDIEYLRIIQNRVYGIKKGTAVLRFNNTDIDREIIINVN